MGCGVMEYWSDGKDLEYWNRSLSITPILLDAKL
jgi:hypothetical protein